MMVVRQNFPITIMLKNVKLSYKKKPNCTCQHQKYARPRNLSSNSHSNSPFKEAEPTFKILLNEKYRKNTTEKKVSYYRLFQTVESLLPSTHI